MTYYKFRAEELKAAEDTEETKARAQREPDGMADGQEPEGADGEQRPAPAEGQTQENGELSSSEHVPAQADSHNSREIINTLRVSLLQAPLTLNPKSPQEPDLLHHAERRAHSGRAQL